MTTRDLVVADLDRQVRAAIVRTNGNLQLQASADATPQISVIFASPPLSGGETTALANINAGADVTETIERFNSRKGVGDVRAVRQPADVSNSTVNYANVTGLSFHLAANNHYAFAFDGVYNTANAATGCQLALNGPTFSFFGATIMVAISNTAQIYGATSAYDVGANAASSLNATLLPFQIRGNITTTASGLLVVRLRSEVASSAVTVKRGSFGLLYPVN